MTTDPGAGDLLDPDLHEEIELVSDLVVAASGTSRHFTAAEVDVLLGVVPQETDAIAAKPSRRPAGDQGEPRRHEARGGLEEQNERAEGGATTTQGAPTARPGGTASDHPDATDLDRPATEPRDR